MRLTIAIPSIVERQSEFEKRKSYIEKQIAVNGLEKEVELIYLIDNREMTIGEKRERLYSMAKGEYCVQIDDDDKVPSNYVYNVWLATHAKVDCIGYLEEVLIGGRVFRSKHSIAYQKWEDVPTAPDGIRFRRTPFCKTPIRTELCRKAGVPHLRFAEDEGFANRIRPMLNTEIFINDIMYIYQAPNLTRSEMRRRYEQ